MRWGRQLSPRKYEHSRGCQRHKVEHEETAIQYGGKRMPSVDNIEVAATFLAHSVLAVAVRPTSVEALEVHAIFRGCIVGSTVHGRLVDLDA